MLDTISTAVRNGQVSITRGIPEGEQTSSFQNATLQGAGGGIAFSIASHVKVPDSIVARGESAVADYLNDLLSRAAASADGLLFEVQVGAADR